MTENYDKFLFLHTWKRLFKDANKIGSDDFILFFDKITKSNNIIYDKKNNIYNIDNTYKIKVLGNEMFLIKNNQAHILIPI